MHPYQILCTFRDNCAIKQQNSINQITSKMRTRINRSRILAASSDGKSVRRNIACPKRIVLYAIVVAGVVLFQDTKQVCEDTCIQMRMKNVAADVVKL